MEVSAKDGPTARQTVSGNRNLPPLPVAQTPTSTEELQTRAEIAAEGDLQIQAVEMRISYLEAPRRGEPGGSNLSWIASIAKS
jgi:hypothetical protein